MKLDICTLNSAMNGSTEVLEYRCGKCKTLYNVNKDPLQFTYNFVFRKITVIYPTLS